MLNYTIIKLLITILIYIFFIKKIDCQPNSIIITNDISCQRFHESFCCTDRIKKSCPEKCATISCPYNINKDDLTDMTKGQLNNVNKLIGSNNVTPVTKIKKMGNLFIVDGTAEVFNKDNNIPVFEKNINKNHPTLIPFHPQNQNNKNPFTTSKPSTTKTFTLFPTLPNIFTPFTIPNIFTTTTKKPLIKKNKNKFKGDSSKNGKIIKNSKNKIIKPPKELVHIDEVDTDYEIIPDNIQPPNSFTISSNDKNNIRTTISSLPTTTETIASTFSTTINSNNKLIRGINCGMEPDWKPCISMLEANNRLSNCCKSKNMPPGCQELCRYDVTQEEVKQALNLGKCSLLNVAPFLECAADKKDNINCCRSKNIAGKSGPQCEVFCTANKPGPNPYGILGIQHITCGQTMYDLLKCHLSGLD